MPPTLAIEQQLQAEEPLAAPLWRLQARVPLAAWTWGLAPPRFLVAPQQPRLQAQPQCPLQPRQPLGRPPLAQPPT